MCAVDGHTIVLFGGYYFSRKQDMYSLDVDVWRWTKVDQGGTLPSAMSSHSITYIGNNKILCFGRGERRYMSGKPDHLLLNDVHIFDMTTKLWMKIETAGNIPPGRWGHTATFLAPSSLLIFAGKDWADVKLWYNDLYILNLDTMVWTKVQHKGDIPEGRHGHTTVLYNNSLLVVGGMGSGPEERNYSSELFQLNLSTFEWTYIYLQIPKICGHLAAIIWNRSPKW